MALGWLMGGDAVLLGAVAIALHGRRNMQRHIPAMRVSQNMNNRCGMVAV
jgi:hypothetical protein